MSASHDAHGHKLMGCPTPHGSWRGALPLWMLCRRKRHNSSLRPVRSYPRWCGSAPTAPSLHGLSDGAVDQLALLRSRDAPRSEGLATTCWQCFLYRLHDSGLADRRPVLIGRIPGALDAQCIAACPSLLQTIPCAMLASPLAHSALDCATALESPPPIAAHVLGRDAAMAHAFCVFVGFVALARILANAWPTSRRVAGQADACPLGSFAKGGDDIRRYVAFPRVRSLVTLRRMPMPPCVQWRLLCALFRSPCA